MSVRTVGLANGTTSQRGASTDALDATYIQAAIEAARVQIAPVPGSGNILGVWTYKGVTYAFRNDTEGVQCHMFKSTTSGWSEIDLGKHITFDAGATVFVEGLVVTGGTSGATGTIARLGLRSGAWDGTAAGALVLTGVSGNFQDNETITDSGTGSATSSSAIINTQLTAGGKFEFENGNFTGHSGTRSMYGVDGVSLAFEYDGTVFMPIYTGMTTDTPSHLHIHKNHLFLSFANGSLQSSGVGEQYSWTLLTGASEIGMGQDITALTSNASKTMSVFCRNKVGILYGTSSADWELVILSDDAGAVEWSTQLIGAPVYMDDQGIRDLSTTQAYGDFKIGVLSKSIDPEFKSKKTAGVTVINSMRIRAKDSYRLFFSDSSIITIYFGHKNPEIMFQNYGKAFHASCSGEDTSGNEILFAGSTDGYVYQIDAGTSFDGSAVVAFVRLPFNHLGSPTQHKRYHKATLELDAVTSTALTMAADFSYADPDQPAIDELSFAVTGGGGFWNEANWNEFSWSVQAEGLAEAHIEGIGTNISLVVRSEATYESPHTLHGLTLHYSDRRLKR